MKKNKQRPKQVYLNRVKCNCVAQKHDLINNCLSCGKVVCALEGQGPCLYCGNIVTRPEGKFIANDEALFPSLSKEQLVKVSQERSKATLHKDTLVNRDKSTNSTANVYDQSVDYYEISQNQWLDEQFRQSAVDKLISKEKYVQKEQYKQKIVFDPVTNKFVTEEFSFDEDKFKEEGKNFMENEQRKNYEKKMTASKTKYDDRIMANQKVKEIVSELKNTNKVNKPDNIIEKHRKVVDLIQDQQQESERTQTIQPLS